MTRKHEIPAPKKQLRPDNRPPKQAKTYTPPRPPIRSHPASPAPNRRGR